jgi:protein SCO1
MRPRPQRLLPAAILTMIAIAVAVAVILGDSSRGRTPGDASSTGIVSAGTASAGTLPSASTGVTSATGFAGALLALGGRAHEFTLTDQDGQRISLHRYRGQVVILTFLYSTCRTICVPLAQQIRGALDELGRHVPALVVSVDPAADTPAHVRTFLSGVSLTGRVRYLTGARARLEPVWRAYRVQPASAGERVFDGDASVLLLDKQGIERVIVPAEQLTPDGLAHDIRKLEGG